MRKRTRFLIVLVVVGICLGFLYPTFSWYFLKPVWEKDLAASTTSEIKVYSREKTELIVDALLEILSEDPDAPLIEKLNEKIDTGLFIDKEPFDFLDDEAKARYKEVDEEYPDVLTAADFMSKFPGSEERALTDLRYTIETHFAEQLNDLKEKSRTGVLQLGLDLKGGMNVVLQADFQSLEKKLEEGETLTNERKDEALNRAIEILASRVDKFGLSEPVIRKLGNDKIEIQIPGTTDRDIVDSFLKGKGSLEFYIVNDEVNDSINSKLMSDPSVMSDPDREFERPDELAAGLGILEFHKKNSYGELVFQRWIVVDENQMLDGIHINTAQPGTDPRTGQTIINFSLDSEGADIFAEMTGDNVDGSMAIVLDGIIRAYLGINEKISGGRGIMVGFDRKEANDIALMLRTGALPLDLKVDRVHAIGPSLGEDFIQIGLQALLIGFIAVIAFMLLYYLGAGLVADIALLLNIVFIVSILSAFNTTLTLTSIAGLILTIGMSVDANVIIFERIKEEYRLGKSAEASVKAGFQKAFWTIMDANITTFIAAIFLSLLGTGPIQGFAITLAVGIVSSMFTALFVSRLLFDFGLESFRIRKLSISWRQR